LEDLTNLRERVKKKKAGTVEEESWILHQDNAPANNALAVK
jgi:hypothetical protein